MDCFDCCAEPVYESDPIEIIEDYLLAAHPSTDIACLCEPEYDDSWNNRNLNRKAMNIHHIGLKRLSEILNSELLQFSQLEAVDVWLGTLDNDLADATELVGFHSFFRRHQHTLQEVKIHTTGLHEDGVTSAALHSQIVDASKRLANLKAVFFGASSVNNQILGTFESASQLRYLRIDFDTVTGDFKICAPNLEYFRMVQNDSQKPFKVDLSNMRNLIKVDFRVSNTIGHHLVLSSDNKKLRWLHIQAHFKVDGDISKVMVLVLFFGNNEQIGALIGRCKSSLRELQLVCSRDVEIDARESIRVLDIRDMKNFSLRTSESGPLDALYIGSVEFADRASPVHVKRVCIVGEQPLDKRFDGTTHVAIFSHCSTSRSYCMPTIVTGNRRSLEALLLSPMVVSPLPELPNIKFLFLPNLEDFIVHGAGFRDQLEQVAAFYNGDQQLQALVRKTVCSSLDLVDASQGQKNAWRYWRSYGGFSSNLWSDITII